MTDTELDTKHWNALCTVCLFLGGEVSVPFGGQISHIVHFVAGELYTDPPWLERILNGSLETHGLYR